MRTLQTGVPAIFSVFVFILMRFRFDPLSRAFFSEQKRIELYAFQTKTHKRGRSPILRDGYYTHKRVFMRVSCYIRARENSSPEEIIQDQE